MKNILILITFLLCGTLAYANLTNGNLPSTKNGASNPPTVQNSPVSTDGTNVFASTLQGNVEINGTTGALTVPGQVTVSSPNGSDINFTQSSNIGIGTPSSGTDTFYFLAGDVPAYKSSSNTVYTFPSNVWSGTNPIYVTGINVGIGSVTPGQQLDVIGTVRATNFVGNGALLTNLGVLPITLSGNNVGIGSPNPIAQLDVEGTLGPSALFNSGNVGINTLSPGQILDVKGTVRMTGFNIPGGTNTQVLTSDASGNGTWQSVAAGSTQWAGTSGNPISYGYNVGIGTSVSLNALDVQGTLTGSAFGSYGGQKQVTPAAVAVSGNIGIGTWSPKCNLALGSGTNDCWNAGGNLAVSANITANFGQAVLENTLITGSTSGLLTIGNSSNNSAAVTMIQGGANAASHLELRSTAGVGVGADYVKITTGNNGGTLDLEAIGGNVGIGSASPGQALDVSGTLRTTDFYVKNTSAQAGQVLCAATNGQIGYCSSAASVVASGNCTCNPI